MRLLFLLSVLILSCCRSGDEKNIPVNKSRDYPKWLKTSAYHTEQTSGISFIKQDENKNIFLLADDVGRIHRLTITDDTLFLLNEFSFSKAAENFLKQFPKADFEEICFDRYSGNVYISIEGNDPDYLKSAGIYKINFTSSVISDTIKDFEKLNIRPEKIFNKYLSPNTGYEGLAADENYFYLGLEGFTEQNLFADSTVILVVDKKTLEIVKEINTKSLEIHTICGLYSDKNNSLYGIDRNNKKLFHIIFDKSFSIKKYSFAELETNIPGYPEYEYAASLESVTMDDKKNIYLVDDPWKQFFIPSEQMLNRTEEETKNNFKSFIPIIFKYTIKTKGESLE
jgi:hypothetical protein